MIPRSGNWRAQPPTVTANMLRTNLACVSHLYLHSSAGPERPSHYSIPNPTTATWLPRNRTSPPPAATAPAGSSPVVLMFPRAPD